LAILATRSKRARNRQRCPFSALVLKPVDAKVRGGQPGLANVGDGAAPSCQHWPLDRIKRPVSCGSANVGHWEVMNLVGFQSRGRPPGGQCFTWNIPPTTDPFVHKKVVVENDIHNDYWLLLPCIGMRPYGDRRRWGPASVLPTFHVKHSRAVFHVKHSGVCNTPTRP